MGRIPPPLRTSLLDGSAFSARWTRVRRLALGVGGGCMVLAGMWMFFWSCGIRLACVPMVMCFSFAVGMMWLERRAARQQLAWEEYERAYQELIRSVMSPRSGYTDFCIDQYCAAQRELARSLGYRDLRENHR